MFSSGDKRPFDRTLALVTWSLCKQAGIPFRESRSRKCIREEALVLQIHVAVPSVGLTLDPNLHIKLLLLPSDKALLTPRNVAPALKEIRLGPGNHVEREQGLVSSLLWNKDLSSLAF